MWPLFLSILFLWQSDVPFRSKEDYQVELKYEFRQRPAKDANTVTLDPNGVQDRKQPGPLPYLVVHIKILNRKAEEVRFKCENNFGSAIFNKKADKTLDFDIDMGYVDDLKDRVNAYGYTVYAVNDARQLLNKIELIVQDDGSFMVNGDRRGKF